MAGATTFFDQVYTVEKDAVCVARLRKCGVIFIGKANMHELGLGVTGNNPNYGYDQLLHNCSLYQKCPLLMYYTVVFLFEAKGYMATLPSYTWIK